MIKTFLFFFVLGTFNLFASETSYNVESSLSKATLELKISTLQTFNYSCELAVTRMDIASAVGLRHGTIDLQVAPTKSCIKVIGPHSMIFALPRGKSLPQIPDGLYDIIINGESHQVIDVLPGRGSETGNG